LKERQTRTSTSLHEKIKKEIVSGIFSTVPHQYQILLYQEGIKNHPNNRPKLNQRECKPLMISGVVRKESKL
jgi:hypothetical protein